MMANLGAHAAGDGGVAGGGRAGGGVVGTATDDFHIGTHLGGALLSDKAGVFML